MWMASYLLHYQKLDRKKLADWTYYHFLDGELSSNHLSWQWVASTFSSKPYIFNADNMNRYRPNHHPKQLNLDYPELENMLFEGKTEQIAFSASDLPVTKVLPTAVYPEIE
jgi:deoxyribodipyrimidine photo-lyase